MKHSFQKSDVGKEGRAKDQLTLKPKNSWKKYHLLVMHLSPSKEQLLWIFQGKIERVHFQASISFNYM